MCVINNFLEFVDVNSQPNGHSAGSTGPTFCFLPNFSTIQIPKAGIANYEERLRRSGVGQFNRSQRARLAKVNAQMLHPTTGLRSIDLNMQFVRIKKTIVILVQK